MRYTPGTRFPFRFDQMQDRTLLTDHCGAAPGPSQSPGAFFWPAMSVLKRTFRPSKLILPALAILIALCGYGYKTSLLRVRSRTADRFTLAKAAVEHRSAPGSLHGLKFRRGGPLDFLPDGIPPRVLSSPVVIATTSRISAPPRALPFLDSALPLRSPPCIAA
jgi:hypothetical protein